MQEYWRNHWASALCVVLTGAFIGASFFRSPLVSLAFLALAVVFDLLGKHFRKRAEFVFNRESQRRMYEVDQLHRELQRRLR